MLQQNNSSTIGLVANSYSKTDKTKLSSASTNKPDKKRKVTNHMMWLQDAYDTARGETALWVAVITQAMMDALSKCKKSESVYNKHEATCWLTSNSRDFVDVCISAGMNPDYVRRKAKQVLAAPTAWRAEAGTGKRYQERKKYRERIKLEKEKQKKPILDNSPKVLFLF